MKRFLQFFSFFLLMTLTSGISRAQYINYEDDSGWNLGFNVGGFWQQSDVTTKPGIGFGITLGKSIYEKEGALLSFDLRGRYSLGYNSGKDLALSTDIDSTGLYADYASTGHYHNHRMFIHNMWDLEGVLTLNRLRENTGLILYGFGGVGATGYSLKADLEDEFGNAYDFSNVGNTLSTEADLDMLRDGDYETEIHSGYEFMPSLGAGIGYQFTPHFSMGIEHKINFPLHDNLDGVSRSAGSFVNDRLHYTALTFRWNLFRGRATVNPPITHTPPPVDPIVATPTRNKPVVNIINPMHSPHTTHNNHYTIKANVYYVDGAQNITFRHNGALNTNFTYNVNSKRFTSNVFLVPGKNVFEIVGTNEAGIDSDSKIIIYEQVVNTLPPPIVTFTNPSSSPKNVTTSAFTVTATILNVAGPQDVTFRVNGVINPNFNFNTSNNIFSSNIALSEGYNTVEIKGVNSVGQDIESVKIIYKKPIQLRPPVVNFTTPSSSPTNVTNALYNVYCQVLHVDYHHQILVTLNGTNVPYFNFNPTAHNVSFQASLLEGSNVIRVQATNQDGTDSDVTTIIYQAPEQLPPPIVTITSPTNNPYTSSQSSIDVYANVLHVNGKSDIKLKINGISSTNFSYNTVTKIMAISSGLVEGSNTFSITATNTVGSDNAGTTVIYKKPAQLRPPVISITKPISNPYNTTLANEIVHATVLNVPDATHIGAKFNGTSTNAFSYDPVTKKFTYNANLIIGANILEITAWNSAGSAAKSQTIIYTNEAPPCNDPVIAITQPASSPFVVSSPKGAVLGKITGASSIVVKINGVPTPGYNFNLATGLFELFDNSVKEGANTYEITAINNCGQVQKVVTIIYEKQTPPCIEPTIELDSPDSYSTSTNAATFNFSAFARNVETRTKITLTLNGSSVPFNFNTATKQVNSALTLKAGVNVLIIKGTNDCGADMATIRIDSRKIGGGIKLPPTVTITNPSTASYTSPTPATTVTATVQRVYGKSEISVNFEGTAVPFTYNAAAKQVTVPLTLSEGSHTLEIGVANANGSASDEVELIYKKEEVPCDPPVVTLDPQFNSTVAVTSETGTITGTITGATTVVVKKDGMNHSDFTYNSTSGQIVVNYSALNQGNNDFNIYGFSDCGRHSAAVKIDYTRPVEPCDKPAVVIAEASGQTVNVTVANGMFTAYAGGATSVVVQKGGSAYSNFTFDAGSGNVVVNYNSLNEGPNVFTVKGINECGETSDTYTIIYTAPCVDPTITGLAASGTYEVTSLPYQFSINADNATAVTATLNGGAFSGFTFSATTGEVQVTATSLNAGVNTLVITATNACGTATATAVLNHTTSTPCQDPKVTMPPSVAANQYPVNALPFVMNITAVTATSVSATLNGVPFTAFTFSSSTGQVQVNIATLNEGANTFVFNATNDCGTTTTTSTLNYSPPEPPCDDPVISPTSASTVTILTGATTVVLQDATGVDIILDGSPYANYTFSGTSGILTIQHSGLNSGNNNFEIEASNDCSVASATVLITYNPPATDPGPCGPRFNPGNSAWEFCLITPSGTYNRDDLNSGFSYSGPASSAYFKPIAGGGDAVVGGSPYALSNGQYYHFTGSLTVDVSSTHPGSMGHWEICIESNSAPVHGNGSNKPESPCEDKSNNGGGNGKGDGNGSGAGTGGSGDGTKSLDDDEARKLEEQRKAAEAARKAEEQRKAAEAARKAEEARKNAEAARKAEEARKKAEAARKAEEARKKAEAARKAEEARKKAEAARKAEEARKKAEAVRKAEEARKKAEAARKAEEARKKAEAARKAEEARKKAEAARKAEEEKKKAEAEKKKATPSKPVKPTIGGGKR